MNIIFITTLNPDNINAWSGTIYHIYNTLSKNHNIKVLGQNMLNQSSYYSRNNFINNLKTPMEEYTSIFGNICADKISHFSNCDLIFFGDLYLTPFLNIDIPIVHLSDVTFHLFKDYLGNKDVDQIKKLEKLEKMVLDKYEAIIYSSEWTKLNTIDYYSVDPNKIHVIELGANIPTPNEYTINIDTSVCNLVFIGKNWKKKGGDKILEAYKKLKTEDFPCTLTIIGSTPETSQEEDQTLTIIPFLDKSKPEHMLKLCSILAKAHFLVLPTEFDAYGIVFCEASAYAVPSIATNVGGVNQPVHEGKNGYLLSPDATGECYAEKIKTVFNDKENYIKLRATSRHEFETRLNWDVWGERVNKIFKDVVFNYKKKNEEK